MALERPEYDANGIRYVRCLRCGMGWIEGRESVELIPGSGEFTQAGERDHECPEPFPYETAKVLAEFAAAHGGVVVDQKTIARIKLGLQEGT